ncbi:MAG: large subunit ribosomal protein L21 [Alphaproteobacteria bacterium]|jgi:large subunit ribosomal protein L21
MYAVVKTGGKQFKVAENDLLRVEKIDAEVGTIITLDDVLLVANDNDVTVGAPLIEGASVAIEILAQRRARKIVIFKKRRRKSSRSKNGHRQHFTLIRISEILTGGAKPSKAPQGMPEKAHLLALEENDADLDEVEAVSVEAVSVEAVSVEAVSVEATPEIAVEEKPKKARAKKAPAKAAAKSVEDTDSAETSEE